MPALERLQNQLDRFKGWAVGKPKSLNSIRLPKGWSLDRWPRGKDGWWEGTLARDSLVVRYDQGMEDAWFWEPGNLHDRSEILEDYREDIWNGQRVRMGRWRNPVPGKFYYQVTFSEVPITFGAWLENVEQEREIRGLLSSYRGKRETFTWIPNPLLALLSGLVWILETYAQYHHKWVLFKLLVLLVIVVWASLSIITDPVPAQPGRDAFRNVNTLLIRNPGQNDAFGETEDDHLRAQKFLEHYKPAYTKARESLLFDGSAKDHCVVYSKAHGKTALFLCYPQGLKKQHLEPLQEAAWSAAVAACQETNRKPDTEALVGLRDSLLYRHVLQGTLAPTPASLRSKFFMDPDLYFMFAEEN